MAINCHPLYQGMTARHTNMSNPFIMFKDRRIILLGCIVTSHDIVVLFFNKMTYSCKINT